MKICGLVILMTCVLSSCASLDQKIRAKNKILQTLPEALNHSEIREIFANIFLVQGENSIIHHGIRIQSSRNMVVIKNNDELTLINSIRLNEKTLSKLTKLGKIKNVIRLGPFHGRDDAFYQILFKAKLWGLGSMEFSHGEELDYDLTLKEFPMEPLHAHVIEGAQPEAYLFLDKHGGILFTCDSIKNWTRRDQFFDQQTFQMMTKAGATGESSIDQVWLSAAKPNLFDLRKINSLNFKHLVSAHGDVLMNDAKIKVKEAIAKIK